MVSNTNMIRGLTRGVRITRRIIKHLQMAQIGAAFFTWTTATSDLRAAEETRENATKTMLKTVRRLSSGKVSRAWQSWLALVASAQHQDHGVRLLRRMMQRWRKNDFRRGFASWHLATQESAREQKLAVGTVARSLRRWRLSQLALAWRAFVFNTDVTKSITCRQMMHSPGSATGFLRLTCGNFRYRIGLVIKIS